MSEPFLGEIKLIAFGYAPKGWAVCNGQLLPINQNQALFSLLGTTYGGDGRVTFALPNLLGRVPLHIGQEISQGQSAGEASHTLTVGELPTHAHPVLATDASATTGVPDPLSMLATSVGSPAYAPAQNLVAMDAGALAPAGGSQPHENRQPYLVLLMCIALQGIFPSRN
ncbi:tail collar protein [Intrasporangium oryzae NRRL B-24470]|uniref:Tail collar protein n=1 Tax=Intrasporangium oryzae NRRL B-24470 TaxID=1386089 RepID=W9G7U6_9MICO|nr:tail fiber protein [Intrasporangium oryzae]EWT02090.1 tail collar protein [Intrasporangium oryzae NRRL B-24470]